MNSERMNRLLAMTATDLLNSAEKLSEQAHIYGDGQLELVILDERLRSGAPLPEQWPHAAELAALRAKVERYEEALNEIVDYRSYALEAGRGIDDKDVEEMECIAKEALEP